MRRISGCPYPIVKVEWADSYGPDGWVHLSEHEPVAPTCYTVGFLYRQENSVTTILLTWSAIREHDPIALGVLNIPDGAIKKLTYLTKRPPPATK